MYLKQKGLKISGSKAELIDRVLTHARGNLGARDAVEDEESPSSCEDNTSSESSGREGEGGGLGLILSLCEGG